MATGAGVVRISVRVPWRARAYLFLVLAWCRGGRVLGLASAIDPALVAARVARAFKFEHVDAAGRPVDARRSFERSRVLPGRAGWVVRVARCLSSHRRP